MQVNSQASARFVAPHAISILPAHHFVLATKLTINTRRIHYGLKPEVFSFPDIVISTSMFDFLFLGLDLIALVWIRI